MIGKAVFTAGEMGKLVVTVACLVALTGCRSERAGPEQQAQAGESVAAESPTAQSAKPSTRKFDPQGRLLPSDEYVVGVRLPRGCELSRRDGLLHVYRIRAPIDRVLAYFGPMMITGNVERRGDGAVYKRASVRGAEVSPTKVDLSVLEVGSNLTRISITELPPPPEYAPSADQTKAAARESFRMLD